MKVMDEPEGFEFKRAKELKPDDVFSFPGELQMWIFDNGLPTIAYDSRLKQYRRSIEVHVRGANNDSQGIMILHREEIIKIWAD